MLATPALDILDARKEAGIGDVARSALMAGALAGGVHGAQAPGVNWHGRLGGPTIGQGPAGIPPPGHQVPRPLASGDVMLRPASGQYHAEGSFGPYGAGLEVSPQGVAAGIEHPAIKALTMMLGRQRLGGPTGPNASLRGDNLEVGYRR